MTILYDTQENKVLSFHNPKYLIDGKAATVNLPVVQLNYVTAQVPNYNPQSHKLIENWTISGSDYLQSWTIEQLSDDELEAIRQSKIPAEISKRQLNLALFVQFQIENTQIEQMINTITDENDKKITQIEWRDGAFVSINHPMVNAFWQSMGYTRRQLEDLFIYAKDL